MHQEVIETPRVGTERYESYMLVKSSLHAWLQGVPNDEPYHNAAVCILHKLESRYPELKDLWDRYE